MKDWISENKVEEEEMFFRPSVKKERMFFRSRGQKKSFQLLWEDEKMETSTAMDGNWCVWAQGLGWLGLVACWRSWLLSYCALDLFHRLTWVFFDLEQPLGMTGDRSAVKWENLVKVETKAWLQHSRVLGHLLCKASQHLLRGLAAIFKQTLVLPWWCLPKTLMIWWLFL